MYIHWGSLNTSPTDKGSALLLSSEIKDQVVLTLEEILIYKFRTKNTKIQVKKFYVHPFEISL